MENFSLLTDYRTYNANNTNNNNVEIEDYRHKMYMVGSSSTPCTTSLVYDPTVSISKGEMSTAKNNYNTFTACGQHLTNLDHRSVIDVNMDTSVSLGALCDLKFPSENATILMDSNANFKGLPPLLSNLETSQIMSGLQKINNTIDINESSFSTLIFSTDGTDNNNLPSHTIDFLQTPVTQVQSTAESSHNNYLHNTSIAGAAGTCKPIIPPNANLMNYVLDSSTIINRNNDHFITTPATTTATTNIIQNSTANMNVDTSVRNNIVIHQTSTRSIVHSIEELAATSNTLTSSTTTINTPTNSGNIIPATSLCSAATTVPLLIDTNNKRRKTHQQQQQLLTPAQTKINSGIRQHLQPKDFKHSQKRPHQSHFNTDNSNSSNDNVSELIQGGTGYQDNTSSHSQQSANGGGSGGNNGNGPPNPSAGVSLINGIVTLNSGQNPALTGGGNNGGSPASSASGTYMPLLPPNVGATSSSAAHMGGVSALGGGTSASAGASGAEVIDFKHLFEELCPVCGDKVSGYHYGLLTCESCKGFFKRTVQNKKVYTCVAERSCHIDKTQRKRCPFCRFQKCLDVGMKLEAVRADRMRGGRNKFGPMYKRDRARKLQVMRQRQIALQALRTSMGTADMKSTPLSPGYQQAYSNLNIKQEIQIPQVSSLTQSPDSSPSPIAIALGQVNPSSSVIATPMNGNSGVGGGRGGGGRSGNGNSININTNNASDGINRVGSGSGGSSGSFHEAGAASLQNANDLKLCFNAGTHPSSTADSIIEPLKVSPMIREFVQTIDDSDWQSQLSSLLQKQTYNQVEVDLFELMCKVLDQNLFSQVDWARNTVFFKELKVDDQMKLLQHSWSDMLVLDHLHQRIHNELPDETTLNNGQRFSLLNLGLLGVQEVTDYFNELQKKLQELRFDMGDYVCMKFLILLNPKVSGVVNSSSVLQGFQNVQAALLDYTLTSYPSVTEKYTRLINILPEIHAMASRGEDYLYIRHCEGGAPTQTLLMEMLSAKRKS